MWLRNSRFCLSFEMKAVIVRKLVINPNPPFLCAVVLHPSKGTDSFCPQLPLSPSLAHNWERNNLTAVDVKMI